MSPFKCLLVLYLMDPESWTRTQIGNIGTIVFSMIASSRSQCPAPDGGRCMAAHPGGVPAGRGSAIAGVQHGSGAARLCTAMPVDQHRGANSRGARMHRRLVARVQCSHAEIVQMIHAPSPSTDRAVRCLRTQGGTFTGSASKKKAAQRTAADAALAALQSQSAWQAAAVGKPRPKQESLLSAIVDTLSDKVTRQSFDVLYLRSASFGGMNCGVRSNKCSHNGNKKPVQRCSWPLEPRLLSNRITQQVTA